MNFTDFNLDAALLKGIEACGYTTCTDVQEQVLKFSQDGSDLYVQSQTGTGKTAAYLVAIIQELLSKEDKKGKKVLVLLPTRELAVQVEEEAKTLAGQAGLKAYSFYGGVGYEKQISAIKKGLDIIISTPGRLIDLVEGNNLKLDDVAFLVLDEADRMFDMGFYPDLRKILKFIPKSEVRQTMLFSATLNTYVKNLAWEYTRDPKEIEIACENITVSEIDQELLHVSSDEKMKLLLGIIKNENPASLIIFCNTKRSCEVISKRLEINGLKAGFIIGDLPQSRRLKVLNDFKEGKLNILVATDVAARGIDVQELAMVINYDLPNEPENYVHRIGRTARAGKSGKAYTFCSEQDVYNLPSIERFIEMQIPSKVAYSEQMIEDKSAGQYIKTENWHDDDAAPRGGHRSRDNYKSSRKDSSDASSYKSGKKNSYKKGDGKKDSYKKADYKKDGYKKNYKKNSDKSKNGKKDFFKSEDFAKIEAMSFEERMKFYKEKYSSSSYQGNKEERPNLKRKTASAGSYGSYSKNKKNSKQYNNQKEQGKEKSKAKKGFFAKIKAFFGR